jgi:hypothetical protein
MMKNLLYNVFFTGVGNEDSISELQHMFFLTSDNIF